MICVIGIDPGSQMGVAAMHSDGSVVSWQNTKEACTRALLRYVKSNAHMIRMIAIEDAFHGPSAYSSLMVAKNHSWVLGALWCAGWAGETWTPLAQEWRKVHGFRKKSEQAHDDALSFAKARTGKAFDLKTIHEAEAVCIAAAAFERVARSVERPWVAT